MGDDIRNRQILDNNDDEDDDLDENRAGHILRVLLGADAGDEFDEVMTSDSEGEMDAQSDAEESEAAVMQNDGTTTNEDDSSSRIETFDHTLPSRHEYLGETTELLGRTLKDEEECIVLPLLVHNSLMNLVLVPGQILPLTIFYPPDMSMLKKVIEKDRLFGVVHTQLTPGHKTSVVARFGTTAEIYEYHEDESAQGITIKAKGRQRFKILSTYKEVTGCLVAKVKILPEVRIQDPFMYIQLKSLERKRVGFGQLDAHSMTSVEDINSSVVRNTTKKLHNWCVRRQNAILTRWPAWVYDQYEENLLAKRVISEITSNCMIQISPLLIPADPHELSQWAAINLPIDDTHRLTLLSLNASSQRLRYILSVLTTCKSLVCKNCETSLAHISDIFSMSVEGPQGTFVNPGGYVHEMITLTKAQNLSYYGPSSIEHSWFPGYAWTIASCHSCRNHVGWKFVASSKKLKPPKFYGITRKAVSARSVAQEEGGKIVHVI